VRVYVYVFVNVLHVAIWAATGAGFFWPIFPAFGWGIGLASNAWAVYRKDDGSRVSTEEQIRHEMDAVA
jgi:2TM domain